MSDRNLNKAPLAIAITGIGGIFPGSSNLDEFWQMIVEARSAADEVPVSRWPEAAGNYVDARPGSPDKVLSSRNCSIKQLPRDYSDLNLPHELIDSLDPLLAIALQAGRDAFKDSVTTGLDKNRVQVILANIVLPTDATSQITRDLNARIIKSRLNLADRNSKVILNAKDLLSSNPLNRLSAELPAGLLAAALGLGGGCYTLDAACASSLYAIKLACEELVAHRADAVLTGGVSRPSSQFTQMGFSQLHALSKTGVCRPFDQNADGLVVGEGAGVFVLKRIDDAIKAGDKIYGVIRGIGVSNDVGGSLLAPDSEGQLRAMHDAYRQAGWQPENVQLIECHGTGTPKGDAVEFDSLCKLWQGKNAKADRCVIGSVKSNVGHLLTGAGAAGLMKLLLAMGKKTLPPTANFNNPDPSMGMEKSPFTVLKKPQPWASENPSLPRRCALSAFGFGGIDGHVLIEEFTGSIAKTVPAKEIKLPEVAIVAIETKVGELANLRQFQEALINCQKTLRPLPEDRHPCKLSDKWLNSGAYLDDLNITPGQFKISPREIPEVLPQQLLMLQAVDGALNGMKGQKTDTLRWGVYMGINQDFSSSNFASRWGLKVDLESQGINDYSPDQLKEAITPALNNARTVGALGGIVASRVAREYHIGGPSHTFSSGENSGLSALEAAFRALQRHETDTAVVGAVDFAGDLRNLLAIDALRPFSRTGGSVPFDTTADGSFPAEGAVALILKRKEDAVRDGNRIYAVIKGLGKASASSFHQFDASTEAYKRAFSLAWQESGLQPQSAGLIETNGSGDPGEDLIEATALADMFAGKKSGQTDAFASDDQLCAISSSKMVIGHSGCAAGLFSIAKTAICLYQQILPGFQTLKSPIKPLKKCENQLFTPLKSQFWLKNRSQGARTAGVSSIGLDGSFYHAVLQEVEGANAADEPARIFPGGAPAESVFIIGGENCCDVRERIAALKNLESGSLRELARDYYQTYPVKSDAQCFAAIVAESIPDLRRRADIALHHLYNNEDKPIITGPETNDRIFYTPEPAGKNGKIAFVFPGSGNHFLGMGSELGLTWPEHLRRLDTQYELLAAQFAPRQIAPWRLTYADSWESDAYQKLIDDHNSLVFSHVSCCALVSDIVRSFAIEPQIIMGYSLGETAGNFSTRTWLERDEMVRRMRRSNLFTTELIGRYNSARKHWGLDENAKIEWYLGVINCPAREVAKLLPEFNQTYILIENTPEECIIGGNRHQVEQLAKKIGRPFFPVEGVSSVHCTAALPVAEEYRALHLYDCHPPKGMTFISSGLAKVYTPEREASGDSIKAQCIGKIDFPRSVETAYELGARVFLEIGPRASMTRMIGSILGQRPHFARSAMLNGQSQNSTMLRFLAQCGSEGIKVDLAPLYREPERITITTKKGLAPVNVKVGQAFDFSKTGKIVTPQPAVVKPAAPVTNNILQNAAKSLAPANLPLTSPVIEAGNPTRNLSAPVITHQKEVSPVTMQNTAAGNLPPENPIIKEWLAAQQATANAHDVFLRLSEQTVQAQMLILEQQLRILQGGQVAMPISTPFNVSINASATIPATNAKPMPKPYNGPVFLDRAGSMEYAIGKIGKALGEYFAPIDAFPTRVRLPDIPLNFVDRIILVEGEKGSLGKGRVVTQHDVYPDGWYLDNDCMPTGLAVEAGQADLFLSGWLGIDFKTKGIAKYRLLDAVVTFHGPLPRPGDTINYDIRVDRFIRQANTYLFFFEFDGSINGKHLITMRNGCAGFFTDQQLADGKGIVLTEDDIKADPRPNLIGRELLPTMRVESFNDQALEAIRHGDLATAFGSQFNGINIKPQTIPSGKMRMIDRITEINPTGGRFGLGQIKAEIDIPHNAWFLTQHFSDDQVMPGTMMYESCMQSMRVFLLRMGWIAESEQSAFEPILEVQSQLRCRGQVIPGVKKALYEISIKELGYNPEPYAIADALMFADGNRIVQVLNMSIRLSGATRNSIESFWQNRGNSGAHLPAANQQPMQSQLQQSEMLPAVYTGQQILEYAIGNPSLCFGEQFKIFDNERFLARLPNPPYLFVDRITAVQAEFLKIKTGGTVQGQFDLDPQAWYFKANRQTSIPFAVLLEFPLQVCGWYSCFMGSAFANPKELHYRNLDGSATLYEDINVNSGTLTATVTSTKAANSAGMLIQSFDMLVTQAGRKIYEGQTTFGFFAKDALANQVGFRGLQLYEPDAAEKARHIEFSLSKTVPFTPDDDQPVEMNGMVLPGKCYLMLDAIELFVPDGGPAGLGFIRGTKQVDPSEWFFKAHFYQDPVIPGSLGLESFIQLMKVAAIYRWGSKLHGKPCHFEPIALNHKHIWSYRGQVIPQDKLVTVDACITRIDDNDHLMVAEGFLKVDGRIIYSMKEFALRVVIDS